MSQVLQQNEVLRVNCNNFQKKFASLLSESVNGKHTTQTEHISAQTSNQVHVLLAPSELKTIQADVEKIYSEKISQGVSQTEALKGASIEALNISANKLLFSDGNRIKSCISEILTADTKDKALESINNAFKTIRQEHTACFNRHIVSAVEKATTKAGFQDIKVVKSNRVVRIIGTEAGHLLQTEVHIGKFIDIVSEELGYQSDRQCEHVMNLFHSFLKEQGITSKSETQCQKAKTSSRKVYCEDDVNDIEQTKEKLTIKQL